MRSRLILLFGEAVAFRKGLHLVRADPIDETVEVLADAGLGAAPVARLQQHADRLVEFPFRRAGVAQLEFLLALAEVLIGCGDERREPDRPVAPQGQRRPAA